MIKLNLTKQLKKVNTKNLKTNLQNRNGVTLIALVITIIVLLILAGITINLALDENGIINMAKNATNLYKASSEKEYLEQNVLLVQLNKYMENISSEKLGKELNPKNLENSSNWHIIKVNDTSYDKGWNYVEKGTELKEYGKAEHSWLINYETGEIIELEEDNYVSLSAGDMLAVKDSLIINIDSSIIDKNIKNDKESLEEQLGEGVTLEGFDFNDNENSGLTTTSFKFDGVDDYIKVKYDSQEQKDKLAKNGFTFEFYGIWNGGTSQTSDNKIVEDDNRYDGLFTFQDEEARVGSNILRFGINVEYGGNYIMWNAGNVDDFTSDYMQDQRNHNIIYQDYNIEKNNVIYFTMTLDCSKIIDGEYYQATLYVDGKEKMVGRYNKGNWDYFISNSLKKLDCFLIGGNIPYFYENVAKNFSALDVYSLRLYNKALTADEVNKNYEKSVEYHSLLIK